MQFTITAVPTKITINVVGKEKEHVSNKGSHNNPSNAYKILPCVFVMINTLSFHTELVKYHIY